MRKSDFQNFILIKDNVCERVIKLKQSLRDRLGEGAAIFPGLNADNEFNADTEAALRSWQASVGLVADGVPGPLVLTLLEIISQPEESLRITTQQVVKTFTPATKPSNISRHLPYIKAALYVFGLLDIDMVAMALGTIRAETESFLPVAELPSHLNTKPGLPAFSAYEGNKELGNILSGDGARFRGRGYVQLTGRVNYEKYGAVLGIPLADRPELACFPEVAACLLAAYLSDHAGTIRVSINAGNLQAARKAVNGGNHGLEHFCDTFEKAKEILSAPASVSMAKHISGITDASSAATVEQEEQERKAFRKSMTVRKDGEDFRDRQYVPLPVSLQICYPSDADVEKYVGAYSRAKLVMNQGSEGACTGFGLACAINFIRWRNAGAPAEFESVSPRMLYTFARRFDEYEGENYEGSSCRGALKGWFHNGVCLASWWKYDPANRAKPKVGWEINAREQTLGVYYRVSIKSITDIQAAISQVGAVYVSSFTHDGWDAVKQSAFPTSHKMIPTIAFNGNRSTEGGHAFALVGYNRYGFVLQNSWGDTWGACGFALITYEDWLANAMDAWVVALGVPGVIAGRYTKIGKADIAADKSQATAKANGAHWWDVDTAYRHSIVLGNNGRVKHFEALDHLANNLQHQSCVRPDEWFRTTAHDKKRLVIYVHGGLNSEEDAIDRARAMGQYFLGNGCYPIFLVWKTGLMETMHNMWHELRKGGPQRTQLVGNVLSDNVSDPILEKTFGRPFVKPAWSDMKENAMVASSAGRGVDMMVDAIRSLADSWGDKFELHLMGHSAGSVVIGKILENMANKLLVQLVTSCHLYAPACTVEFANREYAVHDKVMKNLYIDVLSDKRERDDNVIKIYRKSLLYFVSNALEPDARTPILGLANVFEKGYSEWDGSRSTSDSLRAWRDAVKTFNLMERVNIHDKEKIRIRLRSDGKPELKDASHGGFDNDIDVVAKSLGIITGLKNSLHMPVDDLAGY